MKTYLHHLKLSHILGISVCITLTYFFTKQSEGKTRTLQSAQYNCTAKVGKSYLPQLCRNNLNLNPMVSKMFGNTTKHALNPPTKFIIKPSYKVCNTKSKFVLFIVNSAAPNFERRNAIRETRKQKVYGFDSLLLFLIGLPNDQTTFEKILKESQDKDDIVMGDFIDTYHNLTLKGVMGLRYVKHFCPNISHLIKSDDDIFINLVALESFLTHDFTESKLIACSVELNGSSPIYRNKEIKWYVDKSQFAGWTHYPFDFCMGYFVIMSGHLVDCLCSLADVNPFFWIDDIYLFGMLPASVPGVKFLDISGKTTTRYSHARRCFKKSLSRCKYLAAQAGHRETDKVQDFYRFSSQS